MNDQMTYGYEPSPITGSKSEYEDVETIARIGSAEMSLIGKFEVFQQEVLQNFYRLAGHIYSAQDLRKLNLEKRPNFEWNLFLPIILSIVGNFKGQVPGLEFTGISPQDQQGADLHQTLSNYFLTQANDIEYEISKAFLWAVVGRIGWLKTSWSYLKDPDGMILIEWYDSLRIKFDTNWRKRDTSDMRYMSDSGFYEASEIIDIYAKNNHSLRDEIYEKARMIVGDSALKKGKMKKMLLTWAERFLNASLDYQGQKHGFDSFSDADVAYNYGATWYNGDGRFKVIDWYEKRQQPIMTVTDLKTGLSQDITDLVKDKKRDSLSEKNWYDSQKLQQILQQYNEPKIREEWRDVIWQTSVVPALNLKLYDDMQKYQNGNFKFVPVLAHDFHPDILETKSVLDNIIDPVSSYNLRRNTMLTYVMKVTQGGWIAEQGAVKGFEDELMSNELVGLKKVADGAISNKRMIKLEPPVMPQGLLEESMLEKEDTNTISGQGPNMQGRKESAKETGKLYEQRVAQASLLQDWLNDNAQYALVMVAQNNLALAQKYLILPRVIPLLGDDSDPQWLQLNASIMGKLLNDVSFGRYRIKISKNPLGKKALELEFQKIMSMNQWLQQLDPSYVDPITTLEHSGINARFKMIAHIKNAQQQIQQQVQQKQQQDQAQQQQQQVQQQQDSKDNEDAKRMMMNNQKVDLLKKMNELHKSTMDNRQVADTAVADHIMSQLS